MNNKNSNKAKPDNGANRSGQQSDNLDLRIQDNQLIDDEEPGDNHGLPSHHQDSDANPSERSDREDEIKNLGSHGGGGDAGRRKIDR